MKPRLSQRDQILEIIVLAMCALLLLGFFVKVLFI